MPFLTIDASSTKEAQIENAGTAAGNYSVTVSATVNGATKTQTLAVTVN